MTGPARYEYQPGDPYHLGIARILSAAGYPATSESQ